MEIIKEAIENPSGTQAYEALQKANDERLSMIPIIISLIFDAQEPIIKRTIAGTMLNQVLDRWKFSDEEERSLGDQLIKKILGSYSKFMTTIETRLLDISLSYLIKSKIETGQDVNDSLGLGDLSKVKLSTLYRIIKTLSRENNQTLKVKVALKKTSLLYGEMFWEIYSKSQPQSETFYLSLKILTLFALHFNRINLSVFVQRALIDLDIAINQAYEERIILRYGKFFNQLESIPESVLKYYAEIVDIYSSPNQITVPNKIFFQACEITFKAIFDSNTELEKLGLTTDHVTRWIDRILWDFLEDEDESLQMVASDLFQLFARKSRSQVKPALERFIDSSNQKTVEAKLYALGLFIQNLQENENEWLESVFRQIELDNVVDFKRFSWTMGKVAGNHQISQEFQLQAQSMIFKILFEHQDTELECFEAIGKMRKLILINGIQYELVLSKIGTWFGRLEGYRAGHQALKVLILSDLIYVEGFVVGVMQILMSGWIEGSMNESLREEILESFKLLIETLGPLVNSYQLNLAQLLENFLSSKIRSEYIFRIYQYILQNIPELNSDSPLFILFINLNSPPVSLFCSIILLVPIEFIERSELIGNYLALRLESKDYKWLKVLRLLIILIPKQIGEIYFQNLERALLAALKIQHTDEVSKLLLEISIRHTNLFFKHISEISLERLLQHWILKFKNCRSIKMKKKIIVGIWVIGFIELANKFWNEGFNENEDEDEEEDDDDFNNNNNDDDDEQDDEIWLGKIGLYEKFRLKQLEKVDGIIESLELIFFSK